MSISFNSRTTPIAPAIWTPPISAELYAQGFANQAKDTKEYQQNVQNSANDFLSIQAMSPQDQEVLDGYKQQFLKDVGNLNVGNLKSPQAKQQLNQYITQYASNADILGIAQRSSALRQDQELQKEYEMKGKKYVSKLQRQAQKYLQDGNYYTDQRFNQSGYISPENKDITEWAKSVPEWKKYVENGIYDDKQEGKAVGQLYNRILQGFQSDENWKNLHKDNFEQSIEGQNIYDFVNAPAESVAQLFPNLPEGSQEQQKAVQTIQELKSLGQNPYAESAIKNRMEDLYIRDQAAMAAQAEQYTNTVDHKWNEVKKDATDFAQQKALKVYDLQLKTGLTPNKDESQASYLQRLSEAAQDKDLEIAQAKAKIQTDAEAEREANKQINRVELQKFKNATKGTKEYSSNVAERVIKGLGDGTLDSDKDATALKGMILANKNKLFNPENGKTLIDPNIMSVTINPDTQDVTVKYDTGIGNSHEYTYKYNDVLDVINDTPTYTPNSSVNVGVSQSDWNDKWSKLKPGETIVGLDGNTYTKK